MKCMTQAEGSRSVGQNWLAIALCPDGGSEFTSLTSPVKKSAASFYSSKTRQEWNLCVPTYMETVLA